MPNAVAAPSPVGGRRGQKDPAFALGVPLCGRKGFALVCSHSGNSSRLSATIFKAGEDTRPLRGSAGIKQSGQRRSFHRCFDAFRIGHHPQDVPRLGLLPQQMSQHPARCIGEERLLVFFVRQHRGGNRSGCLRPVDLVSQSPIWAALIERIQNQVASLGVIKLTQESPSPGHRRWRSHPGLRPDEEAAGWPNFCRSRYRP